MCYRDRTYCEAPCAAECERKATPELAAAADRAGLPLALSDWRVSCPAYTVEGGGTLAANSEVRT